MHEVAVILYGFKYRKSQRSEGGVQGVAPWENKEFKERGSIRSLRIKDFLLTLLRILVRSKLALFPASGAAPSGVRGWPLKSKSKLLQSRVYYTVPVVNLGGVLLQVCECGGTIFKVLA